MTSPERCAGTLQHIRAHLPTEQDAVLEYLVDMEHHFSGHPCQQEVSEGIAFLAREHLTPQEFWNLVSQAMHPESLVQTVLATVRISLDERDLHAAEKDLACILPYAERTDHTKRNYLSFRDFIEYAYYQTVLAQDTSPDKAPDIHPYQNTDILVQYGRLIALQGEKEKAHALFTSLVQISPVNDAILFELADIAREEGNLEEFRDRTIQCLQYAWKPDDLAHAYRNMGYYLTETGDYTGAVTCYLMATTWEESPDTARELAYIQEKTGTEPDIPFIISHGHEILNERNIPFGPNRQMIDLMIRYADECKQEGDFFEARKYLSHAKALELSDTLEREIEIIERFIEDNTIF
ncbi:MAG TPA: hypothetical protein PK024_05900 [Methanospirillum sp.]|uniref:tetratricopeptide repeat protein n=1 Tax=Methanospirillum sp. TaxID=45200 RepID=UPI002BD3B25B|nr:hypothetical protein [Methanospirillum sp.]HOJ96356.1 hypothetical protein [Methanospirillum sp.]